MKSIRLFSILKAVGGICHDFFDCSIEDVTTDTRNIPENSIFIALKGENFDGNNFVADAFEKGALACIADKKANVTPHKNLILVEDTGKALLNLANLYRSIFSTKIVAITGSVGKTTTKEMVACVLSEQYKTLKTKANLNNLIGLPKTLFGLEKDTQAAVLEMGMSELGEISQMSLCALPNVAVITNVGTSHLETLKTRENILRAKMEITHGLSAHSPLIINADNDLLKDIKSTAFHVVTYGIYNEKAQVLAKNITSDGVNTTFDIVTKKETLTATIPSIGEHNVLNALCAFAVGKAFLMDNEQIIKGLKNYTPSGMRQKISEINGIKVVEDCYNASPDSMTAAVKTLASIKCEGKKIAVLGDMLELGEFSKTAHERIGELCKQEKIDTVLTFGEMAKFIGGEHFLSKQELAKHLKEIAKQGDTVWFKASRGMKFEEIIEEFSK